LLIHGDHIVDVRLRYIGEARLIISKKLPLRNEPIRRRGELLGQSIRRRFEIMVLFMNPERGEALLPLTYSGLQPHFQRFQFAEGAIHEIRDKPLSLRLLEFFQRGILVPELLPLARILPGQAEEEGVVNLFVPLLLLAVVLESDGVSI